MREGTLVGVWSDIAPVKIGAPHFVDSGDELYLIRAVPESLNDTSAYEFYAGKDSGGADIWTKRVS